MAKSRGAGPGVEERGGIRTTMQNAMKASSSPGSGNKMKAPFDGGTSGIPTTVYARGIKAPSVPKPSEGGPAGANNGPKRK